MKKLWLTIALATQLVFSVAAQNISRQTWDSLYTTVNTETDTKKDATNIQDSLILNLDIQQIKTGLLDAMNQEREKENIKHNNKQCGMLRSDSTLTKVAQDYAEHMYKTRRYDHIDENGDNATARVEKYIPNVRAQYADINEILAKWQQTINEILYDRMHNSSSHGLSVLSGISTRVGIGYYKGYCVVVFGAPYEDME